MIFDTRDLFDFQNIPGQDDMPYIVLPICSNYFYIMRAIWSYLIIFYDHKSYEISVSTSVLLCGAEIPRVLPAVSRRCQSIPPTTSCLPSKPGAFMSRNHWSITLIPCSPVLNHQRAQIVWKQCLGKRAV